jgi:hypothetical protein
MHVSDHGGLLRARDGGKRQVTCPKSSSETPKRIEACPRDRKMREGCTRSQGMVWAVGSRHFPG